MAYTEGQAGHLQKHADIDLLTANHTTQIAAGDVTNPASAAGVAMDGRFAPATGSANYATPTSVAAKLDSVIAAAAYQLRPGGSGFLAFGDSITTAQAMSAGGAGYGGAWPQMAAALSQQRLNFRGNAGVVGDTSTQIRARINDALALSPSVVALLAGANNITPAGSDSAAAFATFKDDIRTICSALRSAGIRVVLCTILPRGGALHTATRLETTIRWNSWLREYARNGAEFPADKGGFEIVDFFNLLADPANGQFAAGYDCGDGLHPSQVAHLAMAQLVVAKVQTLAYSPIAASIDVGDPYNLLAHPLLMAGAGVGLPTNWITSGSAPGGWVEQAAADADFRGRSWEVAYTAAPAGSFREFQSFAVSAGFAPGNTVLLCVRTKVTASSGVVPGISSGLRLRLLFAGGAPNEITPVAGLSVVSGSALHWFRVQVPAGATAIQASAVVFPGTGADFTVRMGEFGLFNLTAMGLA